MMKIAFSTNACPKWSWNETIAAARDSGYHGIEICLIGHRANLPGMLGSNEELKNSRLEIPCLASSVDLQNDLETAMEVGEDSIRLAGGLGVPFVRIAGDKNFVPGKNSFPRLQVKEGLEILGMIARRNGVTLLIETNGHLSDSRLLSDLLDEVGEQAIGILWNVHHPFRYFNEPPKLTAARLGKTIKYLHVEDSMVSSSKINDPMPGEGDIPVKRVLEALLDLGYNGWISLDWPKSSLPELEEPGVVISRFIKSMQHYLQELQG
jgi:fatty-acyl-CoA synthase